MKALKINSEIPTKYGVNIPSGCVVVVRESYVCQANKREIEIEGQKDNIFPASIAFSCYASEQTFRDQKEPITGLEIEDQLHNLVVKESLYSTIPAEMLILGAMKEALEKVYPKLIEEITL